MGWAACCARCAICPWAMVAARSCSPIPRSAHCSKPFSSAVPAPTGRFASSPTRPKHCAGLRSDRSASAINIGKRVLLNPPNELTLIELLKTGQLGELYLGLQLDIVLEYMGIPDEYERSGFDKDNGQTKKNSHNIGHGETTVCTQ